MDIPPEVLEVLKCSSCELYLSRGPVYLQHDGAAACNRCYTPKHPATRNTQYEATARLLKFPCKYQEFGCRVTVPYVGQEDVIVHEETCEYRGYVCPVLGSAHCAWLGTRTEILQHCQTLHPDKVLDSPVTLIHDLSKTSVQTYLLRVLELLFLLHIKVCLASGKLFHSVRYLGAVNDTTKFTFNLNIKRGDVQITTKGQVASQGSLPSSLISDINSLLNVLGGSDDIIFTVTVKQVILKRPNSDVLVKVTRQKTNEIVKCVGCSEDITIFMYRDKTGWRCTRCAPVTRPCKNHLHGCPHSDINNKCVKHEHYFCQQRTECYICKGAVSRRSLSTHYDIVHQDITYKAGTTWQVLQIERWKTCLLSSIAGIVMCRYWLRQANFVVSMRSQILREKLKEYRCEVRLSNPGTGHTQTYTSDTVYEQDYDWYVCVKDTEFSWSNNLDICVDIKKID